MKIVAEIVMAIVLLATGLFIAPNIVFELRIEAFKQVDQGLSSLEEFTAKLVKEN